MYLFPFPSAAAYGGRQEWLLSKTATLASRKTAWGGSDVAVLLEKPSAEMEGKKASFGEVVVRHARIGAGSGHLVKPLEAALLREFGNRLNLREGDALWPLLVAMEYQCIYKGCVIEKG